MTRTEEQLKEAARKAVDTTRYRLIEAADLMQLLQLHDEIQAAESEYESSFERQSFIARNICCTTWKSFLRFGDRNRSSKGLILYWIKRDGIPLDDQARIMTEEFGKEIEPWELAEFMMDFDTGLAMFEPIRKINDLKQAFKDTAGFTYDFQWIRKHLLNVDQEPYRWEGALGNFEGF